MSKITREINKISLFVISTSGSYGYEVNAGTYELNTSKDSKELINILKENPDDTAKEDTKS